MEDDDMVSTRSEPNIIKVGGYKINNLFLNEGISPYVTLNQCGGGSVGGQVSTMFKHLAVPTGLLYLQHTFKTQKKSNTEPSLQVVDDNLYEKLLSLVSVPSHFETN